MTQTEEIIWQGSQSQVINLGKFILYLIISAAITVASTFIFPLLAVIAFIPIVLIFWNWLLVRTKRYKITNERVMFITGIFSKRTDTLEFYRVRDVDLYEPLMLRIFKKGNIELLSTDTTTPKFLLKAVPNPKVLMDKLRTAVEQRRDVKRVRGIEFDNDLNN